MINGNGNGNGAGRHRRRIRKKKILLSDDDFSRDLKEQGKDGKLLARLYLIHPMELYKKRILDEPIQY